MVGGASGAGELRGRVASVAGTTWFSPLLVENICRQVPEIFASREDFGR